MIKNHFNKVILKDIQNFKNFTKCWIYDNAYFNGDVKLRDHFHITDKYIGSVQGGCNVNLKLNHKFPVVFHNLKNYDSHLIMQELGKFNLKINVMRIGLEKCMSLSINNK